MDQQKITEEELNRELKGNKTTAAVCRLIGKIVAVLAFICVVTGYECNPVSKNNSLL